jgi:hypothetical protein
MKTLVALIVIINLFACAATLPSDVSQTTPDTTKKTAAENPSGTTGAAQPAKSPHGYIIAKDYELGRFGGFIGDCTDEQNWPYFWQCMSENAGNGGFE